MGFWRRCKRAVRKVGKDWTGGGTNGLDGLLCDGDGWKKDWNDRHGTMMQFCSVASTVDNVESV